MIPSGCISNAFLKTAKRLLCLFIIATGERIGLTRRRIRYDWLFGIVLATLMFLILFWFGNFRYENSDDMLMVKPFMGFEGGTPANFTLNTHTLLAWLLYGVSLAVPGVAWFSVYQMGLLYFSAVVLGKNTAQLAQARRRPWLASGLGTLILLSVFAASRRWGRLVRARWFFRLQSRSAYFTASISRTNIKTKPMAVPMARRMVWARREGWGGTKTLRRGR